MKKKLLVAAMMAAGIGAAGTASAVNVNPDGLGQVLLYPYYTTQNGFKTLIKVVNTTSAVKAVKVRFLEGMNSQEVLDFNLYLSPYDEWAGEVSASGLNANGLSLGGKLSTGDHSCTAPAIPVTGALFRNYKYVNDSVKGLDRTAEGYVEIIEMGEIIDTALAAAATHVQPGDGPNTQIPLNCAQIRTAANPGGALNSASGVVGLPTGGLYGMETFVNVDAGVSNGVDALALANFWDPIITANRHTVPGSELPSLAQVETQADIINGVALPAAIVAFDNYPANAIDNVSVLIQHDTVKNDYNIAPGLAAATDWVVTFPTKRFYVNRATRPEARPFNELWDKTTSSSCDPIGITYYDREEGKETAGDDDFSPRPPTQTASLCHEVNTISIVEKGSTEGGVFGAQFTNYTLGLAAGYQYGWLSLAFPGEPAGPGNAAYLATTVPAVTTVEGLPVIGFALTQFGNASLESATGGSVLANYASSSNHKGTRNIHP